MGLLATAERDDHFLPINHAETQIRWARHGQMRTIEG